MEQQLSSLTSVTFDTDLYSADRFEGYEKSIAVNDDDDDVGDAAENEIARKMASFTAPKQYFKEVARGGEEDEVFGFKQPRKIIDREDDYRWRRLNRVISPERNDPFLDKTPEPEVRTYADIMREEILKKQKEETLRLIAKQKEEQETSKVVEKEKGPEKPKKRNRWDHSQDDNSLKKLKSGFDWDLPDSTPGIGRWDATPTPGRIGDATPSLKRNRWDETPTTKRLADSDATPAGGGATPGATPSGMTWVREKEGKMGKVGNAIKKGVMCVPRDQF